jgi:hypothetical protein
VSRFDALTRQVEARSSTVFRAVWPVAKFAYWRQCSIAWAGSAGAMRARNLRSAFGSIRRQPGRGRASGSWFSKGTLRKNPRLKPTRPVASPIAGPPASRAVSGKILCGFFVKNVSGRAAKRVHCIAATLTGDATGQRFH